MTTIDIYVVECFLVLNNRIPSELDAVPIEYRTIDPMKSFSRAVIEQKLSLPCVQIDNKGKDPDLTSGLLPTISSRIPSLDQLDVI